MCLLYIFCDERAGSGWLPSLVYHKYSALYMFGKLHGNSLGKIQLYYKNQIIWFVLCSRKTGSSQI